MVVFGPVRTETIQSSRGLSSSEGAEDVAQLRGVEDVLAGVEDFMNTPGSVGRPASGISGVAGDGLEAAGSLGLFGTSKSLNTGVGLGSSSGSKASRLAVEVDYGARSVAEVGAEKSDFE